MKSVSFTGYPKPKKKWEGQEGQTLYTKKPWLVRVYSELIFKSSLLKISELISNYIFWCIGLSPPAIPCHSAQTCPSGGAGCLSVA